MSPRDSQELEYVLNILSSLSKKKKKMLYIKIKKCVFIANNQKHNLYLCET